MEKAIAILIGNENGELSLRDFLAKVPETIRMRIKPSLLRDKGVSPIGSHAIIPVRLLSTHKKLTSNTTVITVEKFTGIDSEGKALLGGIADTRDRLPPDRGAENKRKKICFGTRTDGEELLCFTDSAQGRPWLCGTLDYL